MKYQFRNAVGTPLSVMLQDCRGPITKAIDWDQKDKGLFLMVLAIISLPSTYLYYSAPLLALGFLRTPGSVTYALLLIAGLAIWASITLGLQVYYDVNVSFPAAFFAIITFSPLWLMALLGKGMHPIGEEGWSWLLNILAHWTILQSALGFLAFAVSRDGDMVTGSYGFLNFLRGQKTISQVMFTATVLPVSIVLLAGARRRIHRWASIAGFTVAILAQSGHQTIFLLLATAITLPLVSGRIKVLMSGVLLVGAMIGGILLTYPTTYRNAIMWYEKTVLDERSPKRQVFDAMRPKLANPVVALIGAGPGQFCSRAGLIASGEYIRTGLPPYFVAPSEAFINTIRPGIEQFNLVGESSAMAQPYSSLMAFPIEFGLPGAVLFILVLARHYLRSVLRARNTVDNDKYLALSSAVLSLAFLFCCAVENYAEFVQGLTIPVILLQLSNARLVNKSRAP